MQAITNENKRLSYTSEKFRADLIQNYFKIGANTGCRNIRYSELDLIDVLYLSAFIRCGNNHDCDAVYGINRKKKILPIDSVSVFNHLIKKRLISISPEMPINLFTFDSDGKMIDFDLYGIEWSVHIESGIPANGHESDILKNKREAMSSPFNKEAKALWKKITVDECIDYFLAKTSCFNLPVLISNPAQLRKLLGDLVEHYSLAVCFEMIHGVCDSSRTYFNNTKIKDEKKIQQYLLSEFEKGIKNIKQNKAAQTITKRQLEPKKSTAIKLLFQEVFCFDYEEEWFDFNFAENNLFERFG